jgi:hypothetical protein
MSEISLLVRETPHAGAYKLLLKRTNVDMLEYIHSCNPVRHVTVLIALQGPSTHTHTSKRSSSVAAFCIFTAILQFNNPLLKSQKQGLYAFGSVRNISHLSLLRLCHHGAGLAQSV